MTIIVRGRREAKAVIAKMRHRMNHPDPMWPRVGRIISSNTRRQFSTRGAHFGTPWQPLKPEYLAWKLSRGYPRQILVMTGEMRGTVTGRPLDVEEYLGQKAIFGTSNQLAIWHHGGTRRNGKRVNPPRPILKATPGMADEIASVVADYITSRNRMKGGD